MDLAGLNPNLVMLMACAVGVLTGAILALGMRRMAVAGPIAGGIWLGAFATAYMQLDRDGNQFFAATVVMTVGAFVGVVVFGTISHKRNQGPHGPNRR